jgi:hypothetical protein
LQTRPRFRPVRLSLPMAKLKDFSRTNYKYFVNNFYRLY